MTVPARAKRRSACPLNASLEVFGDRWSLLIIRDVMFRGRRSYRDFLNAEEQIATNILADRLQRLESEGILAKRKVSDDARRSNYKLTEKGFALAPVLIEMIVWAARHEKTAAPPDVIRAMTSDREGFIAELRRELLSTHAVLAKRPERPRTSREMGAKPPASPRRAK